MPVLDPGRGQTREGRLICMVRNEECWGSDAPPAVFYAHAPDKGGHEIRAVLDGACGYMHADADTRFTRLHAETIDDGPRLVEVACWAHARRRFYEAWRSSGSAGRASAGWMKELFALEKEVRAMPLGVRLAARRERALPTIENMKLFLDWARAAGSSVMPIAPEVNYVLDRWDSFLRYTTDRRLKMTSNAAERSIKPCVLGRKNYLFQGSDAGGVRSAIFYTIVETCSANRIDPEDYLADVIVRIGTHPNKRIDELLPWRWAEARRRAA